ncbi:hypothetical protein QBZ16_000075 [Prototheca wickerhamii]|uniref:Uncharacterized protein n=1 Tax=Prototheca wickerhamii TaxID=3111 RepID=A0AAD9MJP3_PROWI|nr:hypothetical protein QBZ16_000075 [Prototheca wickerhamii]
MVTQSSLPKQFDILSFAGARERELRGLFDLLGPSPELVKPSGYVRRRTTSYNPRRHQRRPNTKLEARRQALKEAADGPGLRAVTSRAMQRRRGRALLEASQEASWTNADLEQDALAANKGLLAGARQQRRLETHLWHAKRMRMEVLWGWRLPAGLAGEGRAWRPYTRRGTATNFYGHDLSYWAPILLSAPGEGDALAALATLVCPRDRPRLQRLAGGLDPSRGLEVAFLGAGALPAVQALLGPSFPFTRAEVARGGAGDGAVGLAWRRHLRLPDTEDGLGRPGTALEAALLLGDHPPPLPDGQASTEVAEARILDVAAPFDARAEGQVAPSEVTDDAGRACSLAVTLHRPARKTKNLPGVSLVLPAGWARLWWAALAVCGMHPAGQEEWRELTLRQDRLFFPHDWPQAQARRHGVSC